MVSRSDVSREFRSNAEEFIELRESVCGVFDGDSFCAGIRVNLVIVSSDFSSIAEEDNSPEIALQITQTITLIPALGEEGKPRVSRVTFKLVQT